MLTYHINDNGVIGSAYDGEYDNVDCTYKLTTLTAKNEYKIIFSNLSPLNFYIIGRKDGLSAYILYPYKGKLILTASSSGPGTYNIQITSAASVYVAIQGSDSLYNVCCTDNDEYLYVNVVTYSKPYEGSSVIFNIDSDYDIKSSLKFSDKKLIYSSFCKNGATYFAVISGNQYGTDLLEIYTVAIVNNEISANLYKSFTLKNPTGYEDKNGVMIFTGTSTRDGNRIVGTFGSINSNNNTVDNSVVIVFNIEDIFTLETGSTIEYEQYVYLKNEWTINEKEYVLDTNTDNTRIFVGLPVKSASAGATAESFIDSFSKALDIENIIGIKYKNQFFMKTQPNLLTAGGGDVREGKTFIGWMGYPETGTGKVEE